MPSRLGRPVTVAVLLTVLLALVAGGCAAEPAPAARTARADVGPSPVQTRSPAPVPGEDPVLTAARLLRSWDRSRAAAYSLGSVRRLRSLYVAGAGRADVRVLRSYLRRGLRVQEMRMQVLALEVLRHRPGSWWLRVTDRLERAVAVGPGTRLVLPRDAASTREVRLVRVAGTWRVAAVRTPVVSAAEPRR